MTINSDSIKVAAGWIVPTVLALAGGYYIGTTHNSISGYADAHAVFMQRRDGVYQLLNGNTFGTAFAISAKRVLTCAHCVVGADKVRLMNDNGAWHEGKVLARDEVKDIAMIEPDFEVTSPPTLNIGDAS